MKNNNYNKNEDKKVNSEKLIIDIIFLNSLPISISFILSIFNGPLTKIILDKATPSWLLITIVILAIFAYLLFSIMYLLKRYNFKIAILSFVQVFFILILYIWFSVSYSLSRISNYSLFIKSLQTIQQFDETLKQNKNTIIELKKKLDYCKK